MIEEMTTKKPKTALAKLLDNIKQIDQVEGGEVGRLDAETLQHSTQPPPVNQLSNAEDPNLRNMRLEYIDPQLCKPWQFADRPEDEMGDIDQLAHSIKTVGQQEPVLVRPKNTYNSISYEVIFGNRRWRAAKIAKVKLLAIVKEVSDQDAALYQKEENEERKDLSDLARAKSYKAQMDAQVFASEVDLSKKLSISRKTLNDIMAFIRIPEELAAAIPNYKFLSRAMAVKLAMLSKDKSILPRLMELSPKIGGKSINTSNIEKFVYQQETLEKEPVDKTQINDQKGNKLFVVKTNAQGQTTIQINKTLNGKYSPTQLQELIYHYLTKTADNMEGS